MGESGVQCINLYLRKFLVYAASASMVLLNKAALSSFDFNAPMSLLFFQCVVCVVLVQLSVLLKYIKIEPLNKAIIKLWFPVNLIFVGMIFTSFFALKNLGVPMATVLKNLTNLFTICGDYVLYRKVILIPSLSPWKTIFTKWAIPMQLNWRTNCNFWKICMSNICNARPMVPWTFLLRCLNLCCILKCLMLCPSSLKRYTTLQQVRYM